jgi:diacylglycerol kinase family enzyme
VPAAPLDSLERLVETWTLEQPIEKRRMLIIVNPYATTVSDRLRGLVVHALQSRYDVTAFDTQRQGHATELVREAAEEGYDVVVAFGGDGTVNEAANGLAGTDVPLTHLPGGATNVFCKMLGVPGEIVDATEHLLRMADSWNPRRIDLGVANGRAFVASAGYGLDAAVTRAVDLKAHLKHRFGEYYFTWAAVRTFFRQYLVDPPHVYLEAEDGTRLEGIDVIVQNGDPYTYFNVRPLRVAENSSLDSGRLAGAMLHRATPFDVPSVAYRLFSRRHRVVDHRQISGFSDVGGLRASSVGGGELPLQLDGDWVGDFASVEFAVRPQALSVVS